MFKKLSLIPLFAISALSHALEPTLSLTNLDPEVPVRTAEGIISDNARLILTIFNPVDRRQQFSLFGTIMFELFDSRGNVVEAGVQRAVSSPKREDFPAIPALASHCRCYYLQTEEVEGRTYIRIFDRAGIMWTFGPTKDDKFSIIVRYSASQQDAETAVKRWVR